MHYRRLGRTGLQVSALCLGTMQWGATVDERTAGNIMNVFVERGGNFFDTADFYSRWRPGAVGGEAETILGRWLHRRQRRDDVILATKVYQPMGPLPNDRGLSRKHILEAVDASLRRLQTDYIDIYLAHAFDADTPIDETLRAFDDLQRTGKVRYVGASNYPAWRLIEALWHADRGRTVRYDVLEPHYNMVHRSEFEQDLKAICEQYQIGVIPYSSQARGFLAGKYQRESANVPERYNRETAWKTLETVQAIARELETSPNAVNLAWLLVQPVITAPIIGASSVEQLLQSLAAPDLRLTPEQVEQLNSASAWQEAS